MKTPRAADSAVYLFDLAHAFMTQPGMTLTTEEADAIRQLLTVVPTLNLITNVRPDVFVERTDS